MPKKLNVVWIPPKWDSPRGMAKIHPPAPLTFLDCVKGVLCFMVEGFLFASACALFVVMSGIGR